MTEMGGSKPETGSEKEEGESFGPGLPPGWENTVKEEDDNEKVCPRPLTPSSESDDGEMIGPLPPPAGGSEDSQKESSAAAIIEARAKRMKEKLTGCAQNEVQTEREQWMIELPPTMNTNKLDVKARKFRKHYVGDGDRSGWTETPNEKNDGKSSNKEKSDFMKDAAGEEKLAKRDADMRHRVEQYNMQHRKESLLEMHQGKKAKARESLSLASFDIYHVQISKTGKDEKTERKPFDRERDLNVKQLKSIDSSKMVKEAKGLSNRFSTSQGGSFL
eukprot:m.38464 g.38464  ORF g.38464 m.38464 type:complete len:275 (+) comp32592_c0_seq1:34-858(+)